MIKALNSIEPLRPVGPLPLVSFEDVDLADMDKLEASLDDLINLELTNAVGFPALNPHAAKINLNLNYFADPPNQRSKDAGFAPRPLKSVKREPLPSAEMGRVNTGVLKGNRKKRSRKQHCWTHQDIMELILIWGEVQLEPSDGVHKWQCIYNKYKQKHEWASLSCIQSYFKAKVKCAYNCKLVYDYIVSQKTFPSEADKWIYLLPRNKTPKKPGKHMTVR